MLKAVRIPESLQKVFLHGLTLVVTLAVIQLVLDVYQNGFLLYLPPIGFVLFLVVFYVIQPLFVGVLNVVFLCRLYDTERGQIGFWLNGLFLLLTFSTINLFLQIVYGVAFTWQIAVVEAILLSIPFGYLGKISNTIRKRETDSL